MDTLDRDMLLKKHRKANLIAKPTPKWLNLSWDAFRNVDNHNKSHMFQQLLPCANGVDDTGNLTQ